jgi:sulfur carrier protein
MMKILVNGQEWEVRDDLTLAQLLAVLGTGPTGIAIACNDEVVRRRSYGEHKLIAGDRVEIIKAVAGG